MTPYAQQLRSLLESETGSQLDQLSDLSFFFSEDSKDDSSEMTEIKVHRFILQSRGFISVTHASLFHVFMSFAEA